MVEFNKKVLSNGLTIIHEKRDVDVSTVMFSVKFGAMYESEKEKGVAHFIEHLCFKGTDKRDVREIAQELEGVGGELNAFTHEEVTAYHVRLPSEHLELAVDVLGDIFFNANFPAAEVERERNVIIEEIKMYRDNPRAHVLESIKSNLYEKPFGMFIGGSEETVRSFSRDFLIEKHKKIYVPKNTVLCVVGNNSFEEVVALAEKYVGFEREGIEFGELDIKKKIKDSSDKRSDLMQANLALGIHMPDLTEDKKYAVEIFNCILGEGMSSNLFTEVREKRGLVYGVKSELDMGRNYGYMIIWAGTDPSKVDEVIKVSKEEFLKMKDVSADVVEKAKIQVIGNRKVGSEGSNESAVNMILEAFAGNIEDYYNYSKNINSISVEDVRKLAEDAEFASFVLS